MNRFRFGKNSRKNMEGVEEMIIKLAERVLAKSDNDFGIPKYGGKRDEAIQLELYNTRDKNGKRITKCDGVKKLSYHQSGWALYICLHSKS